MTANEYKQDLYFIEKASLLDEEEAKQPNEASHQTKLKKKKKTKQLLFSTSLNI